MVIANPAMMSSGCAAAPCSTGISAPSSRNLRSFLSFAPKHATADQRGRFVIMRLLFISNLYPPLERGGYEQNCQEIAVRLQQRGHQVTVLTSNYGIDDRPLAEENIFRTLHLQADIYYYNPLDFFIRRQRRRRQNRQELRRVINSVKP